MKRIIPLVATLFLISPFPAMAGKIGTVFVEEIMTQSDMGKESEKLMESQFGGERKKIEADVAAFQKKAEEFQKGAAALSESAAMQKAQELDKEMRDLDVRQQNFQKKVAPTAEQVNAQMIAIFDEASKKYCEKNDFDMLVNVQAVVFAKEGNNVSQDMLQEVNNLWKAKGGKFKLTSGKK